MVDDPFFLPVISGLSSYAVALLYHCSLGGEYRSRTDDLLLAKQAL
jgi:hypothetical protein